MMHHITSRLTVVVLSAAFVLVPVYAVMAQPATAFAIFENSKNDACKGAQLSDTATVDKCEDAKKNAEKTLNSTLATAINLFSLFIAVVAVITIMIAGLRYITANGDAGNISNARNTLLYAVIGLIIAAFAQIIVKFVLQKSTE